MSRVLKAATTALIVTLFWILVVAGILWALTEEDGPTAASVERHRVIEVGGP